LCWLERDLRKGASQFITVTVHCDTKETVSHIEEEAEEEAEADI
jgi:hypothetical protein